MFWVRLIVKTSRVKSSSISLPLSNSSVLFWLLNNLWSLIWKHFSKLWIILRSELSFFFIEVLFVTPILLLSLPEECSNALSFLKLLLLRWLEARDLEMGFDLLGLNLEPFRSLSTSEVLWHLKTVEELSSVFVSKVEDFRSIEFNWFKIISTSASRLKHFDFIIKQGCSLVHFLVALSPRLLRLLF